MIECQKVYKKYEGNEAVQSVELEVKQGSIYGLLGSNGAGKTTLLKIIAGILKQDKGKVSIQGAPVFENIDIKKKIIFMPDTPYFFSQYTLRQMANFYSSIFPNWNEERFQKLQDIFEIEMDKKLHKFSKGMKRQAAFWLAFSTMPDVLILDEPFDGLDPVMRKKIKNIMIQDVAEREMTVLISSHNLREVEDICDHVGILHKGRIILEKDLDDLKSDVHKIQIAFKNEPQAEWLREMKTLHYERRGSVWLCVVRGHETEVKSYFEQYEPVIFDMLPLTLEEIFIYEMGEVGYAIQNILV
ncbi:MULTISPECIES: ABC transporter ATP-binding protein [Bacillaceae]|uniref:ABC-2 type transport system ATP-binding protein n=1 Tax=Peribacillus huizhouensis TaxID=1501239 RepID=A0ABR6CJU9_9BACI|nr:MULTISPECIES: ABC transporter ATP-binding protein [Bacillaceae]MBA9024810.1 ABC-2 type transport system ATP-binding protein [Peribacillus huizhouensis]